ncbi:hypothetical protein [Gordonia sp. WA4-43]|uniref:hypothetical protein n=1 Tax=Gordonia sp. WA4-43 TaxID=2878678 RepID=UPI001CFBE3F5|nr:hypothetical protein [Gordonia sp. WA4-43]UCZ90478.1 hypothetical protein LEL84_01900 [Gordonia sp. WA4-43]
MADTSGLGQAYIDAQKAILEGIVESGNRADIKLALAQAFQALAAHAPRDSDGHVIAN